MKGRRMIHCECMRNYKEKARVWVTGAGKTKDMQAERRGRQKANDTREE